MANFLKPQNRILFWRYINAILLFIALSAPNFNTSIAGEINPLELVLGSWITSSIDKTSMIFLLLLSSGPFFMGIYAITNLTYAFAQKLNKYWLFISLIVSLVWMLLLTIEINFEWYGGLSRTLWGFWLIWLALISSVVLEYRSTRIKFNEN